MLPSLSSAIRHVAIAAASLGVVLSGSAEPQTPPVAGSHPRLINVATTQCRTCHKALVEGKATVHAPVQEDCTSCHEVEISPAGTRITLLAEGTVLCLTCHDGLAAAAAGELKTSHAPVTDSCTSCHDPHASAAPRLLSAPVPELCTTCHEVDDLQAGHGGQLTPAVNCATCHTPHGSDIPHMLVGATQHVPFAEQSCDACHRPRSGQRVRLRARGEALCSACHDDVAAPAEDGGSVHPAVRASRVSPGCLSCHSPHMSANAKLLVKTGPALCEQCHQDLVRAALAEGGHPPAAEDCTACHNPHRAPQGRLLAEEPRKVCQTCHDVDDEDLQKAHLGADMASLECTSCHSPHGSDNPKLLARHLHPPIEAGCEICHEGSSSELVENGEKALCLMCHEAIGELAAAAKVPHPALEVADCKDCHNPHASAQAKLVKLPGGGECIACHDDKGATGDEIQHGAVLLVGCRACHEPHGGDNPRMLRTVGNALCLGCHDPQNLRLEEGATTVMLADRFEVPISKARTIRTVLLSPDGVRGHPVPNHRVSGPAKLGHASHIQTTWTDELSCLACHDPHKGLARQMLRRNARAPTEACLNCHPR